MKAAHGSPPLARPNRHHSNSSYDRMKACSGSKPNGPKSNKRMIMPPFLRLDSAGEVTSLDGPKRAGGHQRTNTCRQGASLGAVTGGNGLLSKLKLISHLVPQPTSYAKLLDSPRVQNGFCALDDLLKSRQGCDSAASARKLSHVKMARTNLHHQNRYGQWGSMCPDYSFLPRGVFPCHVFQAVQSQRESPHTCWSTSGQFVVNCGRPMSSPGNSLLDASWWCSADANLSPLQKMNAMSSISLDISRSSDKHSTVQNRPVNNNSKVRGAQKTCGRDSNSVTRTVTQSSDTPQDSSKEEQQKEAGVSPLKFTDSTCDTDASVANQNKCNLQSERMQSVETGSGPSESNSKEVSREVRAQKVAMSEMTNLKEGEVFVGAQCEGAECMEILQERRFSKPLTECDCRSHSLSFIHHCTWGRVHMQSSVDHEVLFDSEEEDEDHQSPENSNTQATNSTESAEIWECFLGNRFSLSNLLTVPSKNLPCQEENSADEPEEKRHPPKPCPAVTKRWCTFYSSVPSVAEHHCKVRFECGEGKDIMYEYEKGEEETLTVMEIQKTRDLDKQHGKNAASLLQKKCIDFEHDEDPTEEDGSDLAKNQVCAANTGLPLAEDGSDSEDSDSENGDSEEEDCHDSEAEEDDVDDDDFIVFEDE